MADQELLRKLRILLIDAPPREQTPEAIAMIVGIGKLQEYLVRLLTAETFFLLKHIRYKLHT